MDLPADKLKTLREFPSEKKWDIIRDRVDFIVIKVFYCKKYVFSLGSSDR